MASSVVVTIETEKSQSQAGYDLKLGADKDRENVKALENWVRGISGGNHRAKVSIQTGANAPVAASATATLASCVSDTITIGGITFTGTGSPTTELHFETDGDDTADAAALAAAINAHSTLSKVVSASSAAAVVTISCLIPGVIGNFITLSETGTTITVSAAALAGGTGGAQEAVQTSEMGL